MNSSLLIPLSPAAVTRQSGKMATLRLSDDCHSTERSLMEVGHVSGNSSSGPHSKRRLFIASGSSFSHVYDHSLSHSRLATGDVEEEWRTRAPIGPSHSSLCSQLLPN
ncbi:unnamed protein product [Spirodela intermedia]|uniref:Uncharacterized protein n=1 Tax=Spirodela intermedia TaxID=51605 RepID=A0A7I8JIJ7_SPIIN|nr:unnamed protein product [Spirodela intermedia]CAA6669242.1 unnamed protein product [Spirodela intermedia]